MDIYIEKCVRIIKKDGADTYNFFITANPHTGHITVEDSFNHLCPVDLEVIPDLITVLQTMHDDIVEFKKVERFEEAARREQEFKEKMDAEIGGPNV